MKNKNGHRRLLNARKQAAREAAAAAAAAKGHEDRLSKLPNDLLLNILERVDTLDAIRACVLSKQLLKLPAMLSHFFISFDSIPGYHDKARVSSLTLDDVLPTNSAVAYVADTILSTRSHDITIKKLKFRFILRLHDSLSIGKSVARAMATHKVDSAEFVIVTEKPFRICSPDDLLHYGKQFNDFISACPDAFAGLRRLWLRNMRFGELDIPNILSTCKLLEYLRLTHCDSGIHSVLQVEHAQLVELHVDNGRFERLELICLPKLQRVTYTNWCSCEDPFHFGFVPQLSKLNLFKIGLRSTKTLEFGLSQNARNCSRLCSATYSM